MNLHLELNNSKYQIQQLDSHGVTISGKVYTNSLIIMPDYLKDWDVEKFEMLDVSHFQQICTLQPELLLFGTGQKIHFPAPQLIAPLLNQKIGVEVMDTAAACRTYTILIAEGRQVAAALLFA